MTTPITLGAQVRDRVSGFAGFATSRHYRMSGNIQIGIQPKIDAEKLTEHPDSICFDESQLEVVDAGLSALAVPISANLSIKLGEEVVEEVTGCKGIAIERAEYMNGCVYYAAQGKAKKGEAPPKLIYGEAFRFKKTGIGISKLVAKFTKPDPATPTKEPPGGPPRRVERM